MKHLILVTSPPACGKTFISKQLAKALGTVLKQLRNEGYCYVKYERKQRCFHITSRK